MEKYKEDKIGLEDDPEETAVILAALESFKSYRRAAHFNITHIRRQSFYALPSGHWNLLAQPPFSVLSSLDAVDVAIDANADIAEAIVANAEDFVPRTDASQTALRRKPNSSDLDKARSTIRQLYRDWSAEGATERESCYGPVLEALLKHFGGHAPSERASVKVLVPGAGLGRLVFEICRLGFTAEGNEISYHQLMASSFILNHTKAGEQMPLHPWALSFSNHIQRSDQLQKVMIPDIHPGTALDESSQGLDVHAFERMSMSAADFCTLYNNEEHAGQYAVLASVFFVDTAPNIIRYIEAIKNCLRPGGLWINLGPLLWHFENSTPGSRGGNEAGIGASSATEKDRGIGEPGSVELSDDEVVKLVEKFGFSIEHRNTGEIATGYIQAPRSMLLNVYRPSFWVARLRA